MREIDALGGHGILDASDIEDFLSAERRVAELMSDGAWHTADAIRRVAGKNGKPASEGLRRYRSVRSKLEPKGYTFDMRRLRDGRNFAYKMTAPPDKETLF